MTMATRVYQDENHKYQFDFSAALWATGVLHEKYKTVGNRLYDVDFLVETKKEIFLIGCEAGGFRSPWSRGD